MVAEGTNERGSKTGYVFLRDAVMSGGGDRKLACPWSKSSKEMSSSPGRSSLN